jgi:hypothetical protein
MMVKMALITGTTAGLLYASLLFITRSYGVAALASFLTIYAWLPAVFLLIGAGAWWLKIKLLPPPDFKTLLQYGLLAYLIFELLYAAANYGLFGLSDLKLNDQLVQHLLDVTTAKLLKGGAGKDQLNAVRELADAGRSPLTLKQTVIGLGQNMLIDFLKCLLIATITKQNIIRKV